MALSVTIALVGVAVAATTYYGEQAIPLGFLLLAVGSYSAFRTWRFLAAPRVPKQMAVTVDEEGVEQDPGAKTRISTDDVSAEELCSKYLPTYDGTMTVWALLKSTAVRFKNHPFHGTLNAETKRWEWSTYDQVMADVETISYGLERLGLLTYSKNDPDIRVFGLFGPNSSNWVKLDYACMSRSVTIVPLHKGLTSNDIVHCINITGVETIACFSKECIRQCLESKAACPSFKTMIVAKSTDELVTLAARVGIRVLTIDDIRAAGTERSPAKEPTENTIYTISFTSISKGPPQGIVLSHGASVTNIAVSSYFIQQSTSLAPGKERYISYLPLGQQHERVHQMALVAWGARIGFARSEPGLIMEDVALLRPTVFVTVPHVLNRLHDGIQNKLNAREGFRSRMFNFALRSKLHDLEKFKVLTHPVWDTLAFGRIRRRFGLEECKMITTGSGPVSTQVLEFLRCVLCCPITDLYGLAEAGYVAAADSLLGRLSDEDFPRPRCPLPTLKLKLKSVPESNFLTSDRSHDGLSVIGRGELLVKGPSLMRGYFMLPEETAGAIDDEGWLHTGDMAAWLPDNTFIIICTPKPTSDPND